ncbi:hypothetical protein CSQ88_21405 [Iodobacter sp. BJB302]|nr:hypothetical protein CSQ88_21405 [Iodobacter sp. BJB302]
MLYLLDFKLAKFLKFSLKSLKKCFLKQVFLAFFLVFDRTEHKFCTFKSKIFTYIFYWLGFSTKKPMLLAYIELCFLDSNAI